MTNLHIVENVDMHAFLPAATEGATLSFIEIDNVAQLREMLTAPETIVSNHAGTVFGAWFENLRGETIGDAPKSYTYNDNDSLLVVLDYSGITHKSINTTVNLYEQGKIRILFVQPVWITDDITLDTQEASV